MAKQLKPEKQIHPKRETVIKEFDTSGEELCSPFNTQFESQFHGPACSLPEHYFQRPHIFDSKPKRTVLSVSRPGQEKLVMTVST